MANGGAGGGLARGIQFGLRLHEARRERQQRQDAAVAERRQQVLGDAQDAIDQAITTAQEAITRADEAGIPRDDPRVQRIVNSARESALQTANMAGQFGGFGVSPRAVEQRFEAALIQPTPEQRLERSSEQARAEARGEALGTAEGSPMSVNAQFGAVNTETGERMTVVRSDRGLFRQEVDDQGRIIWDPVDSTKIRPVSTQEAGTSQELGLNSTEQRLLNDAEVGTRNFLGTVRDTLQLLQENPDVNTFAARSAGIVNNLQQEAQALGRALGMEFEDDIFDAGLYQDTFENLGIQNERMRSLITSLAFQAAAASGQTGRSVSDRDVRRFIREVGADASDPRAFARVLRDVAERTDRNFRTNFSVRTGEPFRGDLGMSTLPAFEEEGEGGGRAGAQPLPEGIPEGSRLIGTSNGNPVYEDPEGQRWVVE